MSSACPVLTLSLSHLLHHNLETTHKVQNLKSLSLLYPPPPPHLTSTIDVATNNKFPKRNVPSPHPPGQRGSQNTCLGKMYTKFRAQGGCTQNTCSGWMYTKYLAQGGCTQNTCTGQMYTKYLLGTDVFHLFQWNTSDGTQCCFATQVGHVCSRITCRHTHTKNPVGKYTVKKLPCVT